MRPFIQFRNANRLWYEYLSANDIRAEEIRRRCVRAGDEGIQLMADEAALVSFFRIVATRSLGFGVMTRIRINVPGPKQTGDLNQVKNGNQTNRYFPAY